MDGARRPTDALGTLGTLDALPVEHDVRPPAIVVVGGIAGLPEVLSGV